MRASVGGSAARFAMLTQTMTSTLLLRIVFLTVILEAPLSSPLVEGAAACSTWEPLRLIFGLSFDGGGTTTAGSVTGSRRCLVVPATLAPAVVDKASARLSVGRASAQRRGLARTASALTSLSL